MKLRAALLGAVAVAGLAPAAFAERGTDGEVKLTFPQAVSIMNPTFRGRPRTFSPQRWCWSRLR